MTKSALGPSVRPAASPRCLLQALLLSVVVIVTVAAMVAFSSAAPVAAGGLVETGITETGDEGAPPEDEADCGPATPPEISYVLIEPPAGEGTDGTGGGEGTDGTEPDPCLQEEAPTTTIAPAKPLAVDARDDAITAFEGQAIEPFDVTANDTISPSLAHIEVLSGTMPMGLTLWSDRSLEGLVIGTPTECGAFTVDYQIEATAARTEAEANGESETESEGEGVAGPTDSATLSIDVVCAQAAAPIEASDDDVDAVAGERVEVDVVENDKLANAITRIQLDSGELPKGLTLWAGGWLTGTPEEAGTFTVTYAASGVGGSSSAATITLRVASS